MKIPRTLKAGIEARGLEKLLKLLTCLLALDVAFLTTWIGVRLIYSATLFSPLEISPLLVASGVLVAFITLLANQNRAASEEYLENATDLLSQAYEILAATKDDQGRPKNSRINWLTSARLIKTSEGIANLVTVESHLRIWREKKEYWRGRFRDLISPNCEGFSKEYYALKPEHMLVYQSGDQEPLSVKSLAVLYRFVRWPEGIEDPLKNVAPFSKEEIEKMTDFGPIGLGQLLEEVEHIRAVNKNQGPNQR